jgi:hypothetical protein
MKRYLVCASTALGVFVLGVAIAQPLVGESLNVTPIGSGSSPLHPASQELVITNDTDYASFFGGTPPTSPTVDFSAEDVLAVTMGTQPAGSSISITGVDIRTTGFTAGWGFVHVTSVTGSGGGSGPYTINGGVITNTGGSTTNTGGTAVNVGGTFVVTTIITPSGATELQWTFNGGTTTIANGTTTTTGGTTTATTPLQTLTNTGGTTTTTGGTTTISGGTVVVTGGSASTLPPITINNGFVTTTSAFTTTGGTTTISGGTTTGGGGTVQPYSVVKVSKGALAYAFVNDVTGGTYSGPTPFTALSYTTSGGSAPFTDAISIDGSGNVIVNRAVGTGGTTYIGTLDSSESQTLNSAFWNANPSSLPSTIIDSATTSLTGIPTETLSSTTSTGGTHTSVVTRAGFYGGSSTLKSLVDAIRGPAERIVRGTLTASFQGHVHFVQGDLKVAGSTIDPTDPFYGLIASIAGNNVAFDGLGKPHASAVVDVAGKVTVDQPLLTFPNAGADVISTLPAGTQLDVTNLTLSGNYFEVESAGQRGFVLASAVSIIR